MVNWWNRCVSNPAFVNRIGQFEPIDSAMKAFDPNPVEEEPAKIKGGKKDGKKEGGKGKKQGKKKGDKPVDVEDVELDLFGDGDDDGEAAKKAALAAKGGKKKKEKAPETSLIIFEVKPIDIETNLDDLAKRIFATKYDGLIWKSGDYKKEPVAFGIHKLILGFSCEDEKVSVDQVQEDI